MDDSRLLELLYHVQHGSFASRHEALLALKAELTRQGWEPPITKLTTKEAPV
jgi:hypothetical protein